MTLERSICIWRTEAYMGWASKFEDISLRFSEAGENESRGRVSSTGRATIPRPTGRVLVLLPYPESGSWRKCTCAFCRYSMLLGASIESPRFWSERPGVAHGENPRAIKGPRLRLLNASNPYIRGP